MRKITLDFLPIFLLLYCQHINSQNINNHLFALQEKKTDLQKDSLKGKVKTLQQDTYGARLKSGEVVMGAKHNRFISYLKTYDNKGNEIEFTKCNWNGSTFSTVTRTYDEKGQKIEESLWQMGRRCLHSTDTYKYNGKGNLIQQVTYYLPDSIRKPRTFKTTYTYDEKGNKIKKPCQYMSISSDNVHINNGNIRFKDNISDTTLIKYNVKGKIIEKNIHNSSDGHLLLKITYKYDDQEDEIEQNVYLSHYKILNYTYKYDEQGNVIPENLQSQNNRHGVPNKTTSTYDEKGNKVEENGYDPYIGLYHKIYEYDNQGHQIKYTLTPDSSSTAFNQIIFKYDEKGNQIEESGWIYLGDDESGTSNKELYRYNWKGNKYEYDKQGNWIKKIEFANDIPQFITIREITYY